MDGLNFSGISSVLCCMWIVIVKDNRENVILLYLLTIPHKPTDYERFHGCSFVKKSCEIK